MEITVQYFEGCPNVRVVQERLASVGVEPSAVRFVEVASPEEADRIGFRGSPTILFDGEDRFAETSSPSGYACRVYETESGLEGSPSTTQLQAILAA